ncbi:MAG: serine/threonine-protein kinase, partial [Planctomycetota bacterium]
MYCPHCDIEFSGSRDARSREGAGDSERADSERADSERADSERGDSCPYCGKPAEPSGASPQSLVAAADSSVSAANRVMADSDSPSGQIWAGALNGEGEQSTRTEVPNEWSPGSLVAGKYEVIARLGAGGFGTVYKVRHIFRKKYYALKTPHTEFARDETFRVRFEREIEAMERFVHADAVMIRDSGVTETGTPYYTMDFIEGESLKVVLRREGKLSLERALPIIRRVLRVLEVAHAHQIIHRDIKPDNILVTHVSGRETVKVLDFGVAKLLDLVGETGSVTKGMRVGTPKYMSPEQVTGEELDARSDLFSLGIVFYELLTGEHPFAKVSDPVRVTAAILNRDPISPIESNREIPRVIADHILWMLEKRPKRRPANAEVLIRQLGAVEEGVSRVQPVESLEVFPAASRKAHVPLVIRQETSVGERRSFLLFTEDVNFGRANDPGRGVRNDLILRCLPCRSRSSDPGNWQRNLTISQHLGSLFPDGGSLVIDPSPQAKYGIGIGGVRSVRSAKIQSDRFHISLGDKALELDGHRMLRGSDGPDLGLSFLTDGRPEDAESSDRAGYSNDRCQIDYVHLRRASNWPLHEYYVVFRQLSVGSSANDALHVRGAGVEAQHALVLREGGEAFLLAQDGSVGVRSGVDFQAAEDAGFVISGGTLVLPPNVLLPLTPGLELIIGDAVLEIDHAKDAYFKTV